MSGSNGSAQHEGTSAVLGVLRPDSIFFISTDITLAGFASAAALTQQQREFLVVCNDYVTTVFTDNYDEDLSLYMCFRSELHKLISLGVCLVDVNASLLFTLHPFSPASKKVTVTKDSDTIELYEFRKTDLGDRSENWMNFVRLLAGFRLLRLVHKSLSFVLCLRDRLDYVKLSGPPSAIVPFVPGTVLKKHEFLTYEPLSPFVTEELFTLLTHSHVLGYTCDTPDGLFVLAAADDLVRFADDLRITAAALNSGAMQFQCALIHLPPRGPFSFRRIGERLKTLYPNLLGVVRTSNDSWSLSWASKESDFIVPVVRRKAKTIDELIDAAILKQALRRPLHKSTATTKKPIVDRIVSTLPVAPVKRQTTSDQFIVSLPAAALLANGLTGETRELNWWVFAIERVVKSLLLGDKVTLLQLITAAEADMSPLGLLKATLRVCVSEFGDVKPRRLPCLSNTSQRANVINRFIHDLFTAQATDLPIAVVTVRVNTKVDITFGFRPLISAQLPDFLRLPRSVAVAVMEDVVFSKFRPAFQIGFPSPQLERSIIRPVVDLVPVSTKFAVSRIPLQEGKAASKRTPSVQPLLATLQFDLTTTFVRKQAAAAAAAAAASASASVSVSGSVSSKKHSTSTPGRRSFGRRVWSAVASMFGSCLPNRK